MSVRFEPGQRIIWRHELRDGCGSVARIPGVVVKVAARRVQIGVRKRTGEPVLRWVRPENLEAAKS